MPHMHCPRVLAFLAPVGLFLALAQLLPAVDAGPATTQEYADFLKNIKGYYNTQMMHLNAIVGPAGGCPSGSEFTAEPGTRYLEVAQQTNGLVGSICDVDLSVPEGISMGGDFLLKVQFFLTKLADSTTVKVVVNGTECTSGWKYDLTSNSVIFDLKGSCDLPLGAKIEVTYSTLCLAS